jgi:hypothetical protein
MAGTGKASEAHTEQEDVGEGKGLWVRMRITIYKRY